MDAISLLKHNLSSLVSTNTIESKSIAEKLNINLDELLIDPIKQRSNLINFLKSFELTMPSIIDRNFQPIQLAKFKKSNDEIVSTTLIQNLETIALLFRERELIENKKPSFSHEYFRLSDEELIKQVFNDLNYQSVRDKLYSATNIQAKYIFDELIKKIYDIYGLRIFILESNKTNFNFDGIYFDKSIATTFVTAYNSTYSKTMFSLLHEMYHFFQDQGNSNAFDLFSESDFNSETRAEDIRANKFAKNFLLYKAEIDLKKLKENITKESIENVMLKYGISRLALSIELGIDLKSFKTGNIHKCLFTSSKKTINDLLVSLKEEGSISSRKYSELISAISK
jgi:Zn-dependent peptidase ImmA (M78 family)